MEINKNKNLKLKLQAFSFFKKKLVLCLWWLQGFCKGKICLYPNMNSWKLQSSMQQKKSQQKK